MEKVPDSLLGLYSDRDIVRNTTLSKELQPNKLDLNSTLISQDQDTGWHRFGGMYSPEPSSCSLKHIEDAIYATDNLHETDAQCRKAYRLHDLTRTSCRMRKFDVLACSYKHKTDSMRKRWRACIYKECTGGRWVDDRDRDMDGRIGINFEEEGMRTYIHKGVDSHQ
jgi:hypothetical protein